MKFDNEQLLKYIGAVSYTHLKPLYSSLHDGYKLRYRCKTC